MANVPIFAHIAALSFFLPAITAWYRWKQLDVLFKIVAVYTWYTIAYLIVEVTYSITGTPNLHLSNINELVIVGVMLGVYYRYLEQNLIRDIIQYAGIAFVLVWLINKFFFENPEQMSELVQAGGRALLIGFSVVVQYELFKRAQKRITQEPLFWLTTAIIIYCAGSLAVMTMSNTLLKMDLAYFTALWHFNWGAILIANILITRSFLCRNS